MSVAQTYEQMEMEEQAKSLAWQENVVALRKQLRAQNPKSLQELNAAKQFLLHYKPKAGSVIFVQDRVSGVEKVFTPEVLQRVLLAAFMLETKDLTFRKKAVQNILKMFHKDELALLEQYEEEYNTLKASRDFCKPAKTPITFARMYGIMQADEVTEESKVLKNQPAITYFLFIRKLLQTDDWTKRGHSLFHKAVDKNFRQEERQQNPTKAAILKQRLQKWITGGRK